MSLSKKEILAEMEGADRLSEEDKEILFTGTYAYNLGRSLLDSKENDWKLGKNDVNKAIKTTFCQKAIGKIFKVDADIEAPMSKVVALLKDIERCGEWRSNFGAVENIKKINDINVRYAATKESIAGVISRRDIVVAHKVEERKALYSEFSKSVTVAEKPEVKKIVRGEVKISCLRLTPIDDNRCHYTGIISADFKGRIPQKMVDLTMNTAMFQDIYDIRKVAAKK